MSLPLENRLRQLAKDQLARWPRIYFLARQLALGASTGPKPSPIPALVAEQFPADQSVRFVQIGSNDGRQGDPLHEFIVNRAQWSGLFVEPLPQLFERLRSTYAEQTRFQFANVAISTAAETRPFYFVSDRARRELGDGLPWWFDQLASFDREHILKHLDGALEPYIDSIDLPCLSLQALLDEYQIDALDLLHIDTEGYDWQVLKQFDVERYQPRVILYESKHLSNADQQAAEQMLRDAGYEHRVERGDSFAWRPDDTA